MMIGEGDKEHQDYHDFLIEACKKPVQVLQPDKTYKIEYHIDNKIARYKSELVNYQGYSRFVFETERLENMAYDLPNHMTLERALPIQEQILNYVSSLRYSMDAKSSEIVRNKDNTQSSLTHLMLKRTIERNYSAKEDAKQGVLSGVFADKTKDESGR